MNSSTKQKQEDELLLDTHQCCTENKKGKTVLREEQIDLVRTDWILLLDRHISPITTALSKRIKQNTPNP